jgi:hypothetical protein
MSAEMTASTVGVQAKLDRGDDHLHELRAQIDAFFTAEPFAIERTEEPDGPVEFRARVREQPPVRLSTIIGDAIHNLRAALDLLAGQLVEAGGKTPTRDTHFPIAKTRRKFREELATALAGASDPALDEVRAIEPYRSGKGTSLWLLHHLDIVDKHRLLLTTGCAYNEVSLDFSKSFRDLGPEWVRDLPEMRIGLRPEDTLFPLQDGEVLYRVERAASGERGPEMDPRFKFQVAFAGGEVVEGQVVGDTLLRLRQATHDTVERLAPFLA